LRNLETNISELEVQKHKLQKELEDLNNNDEHKIAEQQCVATNHWLWRSEADFDITTSFPIFYTRCSGGIIKKNSQKDQRYWGTVIGTDSDSELNANVYVYTAKRIFFAEKITSLKNQLAEVKQSLEIKNKEVNKLYKKSSISDAKMEKAKQQQTEIDKEILLYSSADMCFADIKKRIGAPPVQTIQTTSQVTVATSHEKSPPVQAASLFRLNEVTNNTQALSLGQPGASKPAVSTTEPAIPSASPLSPATVPASLDEFLSRLPEVLKQKVTAKLEEESIDAEDLPSVSTAQWEKMGFKTGEVIKIEKAVGRVKA